MNMQKTLGLSMIVKDESHVILRVLNSVASIIDYWVIVDTGSTDGTQEIVKNFFKEKNIPGELIEIEWEDFATSRNVALNAIEKKVDYGFWIDADEELIIEDSFDKQANLKTGVDSLSIRTVYGKVDYTRKNIWKTGCNFSWNGPIHELLSSPEESDGGLALGLHVIVRPEGNSWKDVIGKYLSHAAILEKYTEKNNDPRWVFYTAQSYRDAQEYDKAIEWYSKRANIKEGFSEEVYMSKFMIAKLSEALNKSKNECTILYQEANNADSLRGEAIKGLVQMYHRHQDWENAYVFSLYGLRYNQKNPYPHRILFLDKDLYDYQMLELHSLSCYYSGRKEEGSRVYWVLRRQLEALGNENYVGVDIMNKILSNEVYFPISESLNAPGFWNTEKKSAVKKSGSNFTPKKKKRKK